MEETLSWQARLAKANINILNIDDKDETKLTVYYEFMYHPKPGQTKWCKTYTKVRGMGEVSYDSGEIWYPVEGEDIYRELSKKVLELRKELEG